MKAAVREKQWPVVSESRIKNKGGRPSPPGPLSRGERGAEAGVFAITNDWRQEPHVCGLGYGQFADEIDMKPADRERFTELADQWEIETVFLSRTDLMIEHPSHQKIISMGEPVVPLILQRMQAQGGHWFYALRAITGANPVKPDDRGKVAIMQESWLAWGKANGHI